MQTRSRIQTAQRIKTLSETGETDGKAAKVGQPFLRGMASRGCQAYLEADHGLLSSHSARHFPEQICLVGEEEPETEALS